MLADGFFDRAWGGHEGGRGNAPLLVADCGGAGTDGKATLLDFNEIDIVAGFEAKLLSNVGGEGDTAVEGDHSGWHLEPLNPF